MAAALGGLFLLLALRVWRGRDERAAPSLFGFSILYLFALFALMMLDPAGAPLAGASW